jgi:hypothetical protein
MASTKVGLGRPLISYLNSMCACVAKAFGDSTYYLITDAGGGLMGPQVSLGTIRVSPY